ncbi:MAG TPA: tetratricopeptide repeat protein [Woeseiaceae bacterium]|nr:tetratricopeptide repeat protein [Woeseiaceae bacterium]
MSLRRSTERAGAACLPLACLVLLAGCSSPGPSVSGNAPATPGAVERDDVPVPALSPAAQNLFDQAVWVMSSGDLTDAELRFEEFLLHYPEVAAAHVNLAIIHRRNGQLDAARVAVDRALELNPDFPPALNQLGLLLRQEGRFQEAESAYLKAITVSPDYALAHYNLGVLNELYLQRLDVALKHFEQYQQLVGGDELVEKWITDLTRRVEAEQQTANRAVEQ